jgi:ABC-type glycerol-3-phosphate transport system substrate-binding protein
MNGATDKETDLTQRQEHELITGDIDRREFMSRTLMAGLGMAGVAACLGTRPAHAARSLTPIFFQWIKDLNPGIQLINARFPGMEYKIAPVEGFGIERFIAEGRNGKSTWDLYVGQTPFVDMIPLIEADVIEPWDSYIPKEVLDDIIPSIREECSVDGKLYSWPFTLDMIALGWHSGIIDRAGISVHPETWDDYLRLAQTVIDSGAAPFGATFDAHGWRSLAPFAHSLSSDVYTAEGLFNFTHEASVEALILMKKIMAVSHPDVLLPGSGGDSGYSSTPDEMAFAAQRVGYYTKYFSASLRMARYWDDPDEVALGILPKFAGGEGSTVFWTTGCGLLKHGQNKELAAEYIRTLTYDSQIWRDSIVGTEAGRPGGLPPYMSIYAEWAANPPAWLPDYVDLVRGQLNQARAIENHLFGLQQFNIGQPLWETYLKGEEQNPRVALQNAVAAVRAEMKRG